MRPETIMKIIMILVPLLFGVIIAASVLGNYEDDKKECLRFEEDYNFDTEFKGNFLDWVNGDVQCKILMEDGTKVRLSDFNIAAVKTPKRQDRR